MQPVPWVQPWCAKILPHHAPAPYPLLNSVVLTPDLLPFISFHSLLPFLALFSHYFHLFPSVPAICRQAYLLCAWSHLAEHQLGHPPPPLPGSRCRNGPSSSFLFPSAQHLGVSLQGSSRGIFSLLQLNVKCIKSLQDVVDHASAARGALALHAGVLCSPPADAAWSEEAGGVSCPAWHFHSGDCPFSLWKEQ